VAVTTTTTCWRFCYDQLSPNCAAGVQSLCALCMCAPARAVPPLFTASSTSASPLHAVSVVKPSPTWVHWFWLDGLADMCWRVGSRTVAFGSAASGDVQAVL